MIGFLRKVCSKFWYYYADRTREYKDARYVNKILHTKLTPFQKFLNARKYNKICKKYNSYIPWQIPVGENLEFPHGIMGIFISNNAVIGKNCVIFHQVTIGSNTLSGSKKMGAPVIGDNVYIGAGAKIIGGIRVGDNVRIGANAVVTFDVPDNSTVVLEKPRIIFSKGARNNGFVPINPKD